MVPGRVDTTSYVLLGFLVLFLFGLYLFNAMI